MHESPPASRQRRTSGLARHPTNPFATRHTRPGAVVPLDEQGFPRDLGRLLDTIERLGGSAAICGPHGTGKSTLLAAAAAALAAGGQAVTQVRLRRFRDLGPLLRTLRRTAVGSIVCIDGWEVIGRPARLMAWLTARRRRVRLLATSHRPTLLPTVVETRGTPALLGGIVARLPSHEGLLTAADLEAAFARHGGNLRESLADLYDRVEQRRRAPAPICRA